MKPTPEDYQKLDQRLAMLGTDGLLQRTAGVDILHPLKEAWPGTMPSESERALQEDTPLVVKAIGIDDLLQKEFPPRENILSPWLPTQGLAMLYGPRGVGKTHVGLWIAAAVTSGGKALKWEAAKPTGVLYLDGEMPGPVIQERLSLIILGMEKERTEPFKIITPDLSAIPDLTTAEGHKALEPHLNDVSLIIVDNISTLCRTGRENEAEGWLPVQGWALGLRRRGKSVLFIHHAGKGGLQRGTSRREDTLDTVINLKRPADYRPEEGARFEVHFDKARGIYGDDVKPFEARLITQEDGRQDWAMKSVEESTTEKVAALFNDGLKGNEIAEELGISKGTVSKHRQKAQELGLLRGQ